MQRFILMHDQARARAMEAVATAPDGFVVLITEPKRSHRQNSLYHVLFGEIAKRAIFCGQRRDALTWKRLLVEGYVQVARTDAKAEGKPDPFPDTVEFLPSLDGLRPVPLGVLSRHLTKEQAGELIEYTLAFAAGLGIDLMEEWDGSIVQVVTDESAW